MKIQIVLAFFLAIILLVKCVCSPEREFIENPNECTKYACQMHPDKTSAVPAKCPECHIKMKPEIIKTKNDSIKTNL